MNTILKSNGKLYYLGDGKPIDVTDKALKFMMYGFQTERGVTLRQFLSLFNNKKSIEILDNVLTNCFFEPLMKEAFRENKKPDPGVHWLLVERASIELSPDSHTIKGDKKKNSVFFGRTFHYKPSFEGGSHYIFHGKRKGKKESYGLSYCSITNYMDIPLKISKTFPIYEIRYKNNKLKSWEKIYDITGDTKMIDVLFAICWDMTFDGVYTIEDDEKIHRGEKTGHEVANALMVGLKEIEGKDIDAT